MRISFGALMSRDNANNKMATRSVDPNDTDSDSAQSEGMSESGRLD